MTGTEDDSANPPRLQYPRLQYLGRLRSLIRAQEMSILLPLFAFTFLLWIFLELADEVEENTTLVLDRAVLLSLRVDNNPNDPIGPEFVEEMVRDITALGSFSVMFIATLTTVGFLVLDRKPKIAKVVVVATIGAVAMSSSLKLLIARDRPDLVPHEAQVYSKSFPSGHATQSAAVYLTLGVLLARQQQRRRVRAFVVSMAVLVVVLVGLSRIYLGVHWPTDVLAGWTAGTGWAILCWMLARRWSPSG